MPAGRRRRAPRANRFMTDLFAAVHACGDLIDYWDVGRRSDGVVVHAKSRARCTSQEAAIEVAHTIAERLVPPGATVVRLSASARRDGAGEPGWHGLVEMVIT